MRKKNGPKFSVPPPCPLLSALPTGPPASAAVSHSIGTGVLDVDRFHHCFEYSESRYLDWCRFLCGAQNQEISMATIHRESFG